MIIPERLVGNVAALVNSSGEIQEGYKYAAYGTVTVLTSDGEDDTWFTSDDDTATTSAIGNPYTFTGRRLDPETMLMYFRTRMYETDDGSFISRDLGGYIDGMSLYLAYFAPFLRDPFGVDKQAALSFAAKATNFATRVAKTIRDNHFADVKKADDMHKLLDGFDLTDYWASTAENSAANGASRGKVYKSIAEIISANGEKGKTFEKVLTTLKFMKAGLTVLQLYDMFNTARTNGEHIKLAARKLINSANTTNSTDAMADCQDLCDEVMKPLRKAPYFGDYFTWLGVRQCYCKACEGL